MKLLFTFISAVFILFNSVAYGQVESEQSEPTPPQEATIPPEAPAVAPAAKVAPAKKAGDNIKGNAGSSVKIVEAKGECAGGLKPVGITNTHANWAIKAAVDVMVVFSGRMSKKTVIIDNLMPGEVRNIGCTGCIENRTGETCTTYKIIIAQYKPQ
jgi:hypothetical protein